MKIKYTKWKNDGPRLPIEFARKSRNGRLTLVIYDEYLNEKDKWVNVLWNEMDVQSIQEAIGNLCTREETILKNIGFIYEEMKNKINFDDKNKWFHRENWQCLNIRNMIFYNGRYVIKRSYNFWICGFNVYNSFSRYFCKKGISF
ncbi:MAG: hypothetical protein J7K95_00425 [Thermoplasmata archaeon]|nr:hypothetical protein [Thermoplasmata archaeon]